MAKTAQDYPVSFPFGATSEPYSKANPHKGDDRACPSGTPVLVNGVQIGLVGSTGYSTGPHLHTGKYLNGTAVNPRGQGFSFKDAKVTEVGEDKWNGKFVRIQADGYSWVYLHLSKITVKKGEVLDNKKPIGHARANQIFKAVLLRGMTAAEFNKHHKGKTELQLFEQARTSTEHKNLVKKLENADSNSKFKVLSQKVKELLPFTN